jgi:hypothetical protein
MPNKRPAEDWDPKSCHLLHPSKRSRNDVVWCPGAIYFPREPYDKHPESGIGIPYPLSLMPKSNYVLLHNGCASTPGNPACQSFCPRCSTDRGKPTPHQRKLFLVAERLTWDQGFVLPAKTEPNQRALWEVNLELGVKEPAIEEKARVWGGRNGSLNRWHPYASEEELESVIGLLERANKLTESSFKMWQRMLGTRPKPRQTLTSIRPLEETESSILDSREPAAPSPSTALPTPPSTSPTEEMENSNTQTVQTSGKATNSLSGSLTESSKPSFETLADFYYLLDRIERTSYVGSRFLEAYAEYLSDDICSDCWSKKITLSNEDTTAPNAQVSLYVNHYEGAVWMAKPLCAGADSPDNIQDRKGPFSARGSTPGVEQVGDPAVERAVVELLADEDEAGSYEGWLYTRSQKSQLTSEERAALDKKCAELKAEVERRKKAGWKPADWGRYVHEEDENGEILKGLMIASTTPWDTAVNKLLEEDAAQGFFCGKAYIQARESKDLGNRGFTALLVRRMKLEKVVAERAKKGWSEIDWTLPVSPTEGASTSIPADGVDEAVVVLLDYYSKQGVLSAMYWQGATVGKPTTDLEQRCADKLRETLTKYVQRRQSLNWPKSDWAKPVEDVAMFPPPRGQFTIKPSVVVKVAKRECGWYWLPHGGSDDKAVERAVHKLLDSDAQRGTTAGWIHSKALHGVELGDWHREILLTRIKELVKIVKGRRNDRWDESDWAAHPGVFTNPKLRGKKSSSALKNKASASTASKRTANERYTITGGNRSNPIELN